MSQLFRVLAAVFIGCLILAGLAGAQETPEGYCAALPGTYNTETTLHTVRVGINYRY